MGFEVGSTVWLVSFRDQEITKRTITAIEEIGDDIYTVQFKPVKVLGILMPERASRQTSRTMFSSKAHAVVSVIKSLKERIADKQKEIQK